MLNENDTIDCSVVMWLERRLSPPRRHAQHWKVMMCCACGRVVSRHGGGDDGDDEGDGDAAIVAVATASAAISSGLL